MKPEYPEMRRTYAQQQKEAPSLSSHKQTLIWIRDYGKFKSMWMCDLYIWEPLLW